jgi:hypothetical protein
MKIESNNALTRMHVWEVLKVNVTLGMGKSFVTVASKTQNLETSTSEMGPMIAYFASTI